MLELYDCKFPEVDSNGKIIPTLDISISNASNSIVPQKKEKPSAEPSQNLQKLEETESNNTTSNNKAIVFLLPSLLVLFAFSACFLLKKKRVGQTE